jgi:ABC-type uncharacterized transport system substrate-binding protein
LANLSLLAKPTCMAIVPWLLVFFIKGASSSPCSAVRLPRGRSRRARSNGRGSPVSGIWVFVSASWHTPRVTAFRAGLRDLGYAEGNDIVIEFRWAEGRYDKLPALAAELVRLNVDVIVTHRVPGAIAAKQATSTIPIVITAASDLLAFGLVESLARPGGNLTGSSFFNAELVAKRLELLKELAPSLAKAAALLNADNLAGNLEGSVRSRGTTAPGTRA